MRNGESSKQPGPPKKLFGLKAKTPTPTPRQARVRPRLAVTVLGVDPSRAAATDPLLADTAVELAVPTAPEPQTLRPNLEWPAPVGVTTGEEAPTRLADLIWPSHVESGESPGSQVSLSDLVWSPPAEDAPTTGPAADAVADTAAEQTPDRRLIIVQSTKSARAAEAENRSSTEEPDVTSGDAAPPPPAPRSTPPAATHRPRRVRANAKRNAEVALDLSWPPAEASGTEEPAAQTTPAPATPSRRGRVRSTAAAAAREIEAAMGTPDAAEKPADPAPRQTDRPAPALSEVAEPVVEEAAAPAPSPMAQAAADAVEVPAPPVVEPQLPVARPAALADAPATLAPAPKRRRRTRTADASPVTAAAASAARAASPVAPEPVEAVRHDPAAPPVEIVVPQPVNLDPIAEPGWPTLGELAAATPGRQEEARETNDRAAEEPVGFRPYKAVYERHVIRGTRNVDDGPGSEDDQAEPRSSATWQGAAWDDATSDEDRSQVDRSLDALLDAAEDQLRQIEQRTGEDGDLRDARRRQIAEAVREALGDEELGSHFHLLVGNGRFGFQRRGPGYSSEPTERPAIASASHRVDPHLSEMERLVEIARRVLGDYADPVT